MRSTRTLVLAFAVLALAFQGLASAKPKIALVAFEGDKKGAAHEAVSDALGDDVSILGSKQVSREIDDLGYDATTLSDKELKKLAKELEADAIVQAKLTTHGKDKVLHFKLFVHGKKEKGFKVEFGSLKSAAFRQKLHDKLLEKLGFSTTPDADATPTPPTGDDASALKPKRDGGDDSSSTKKPAPEDGDASSKPKTDGDAAVSAHVDVAPASSVPGVHSANRDAVRIDIGPSGTQRSLSFNSRVFPQAPLGYSNTFVPGFRIEGEIFPFAFGNPDRAISGIGIGGLFDDTLLLNLTTTIQPGTKFPVSQRRYEIGPRYRLMLGHTDTSPSIIAAVSYGHRTFTVNRSALNPGNLLDIPDVDYRGYNVDVHARIPFTPKLQLTFGGGAILLNGAGAIQTQAQYGQAKIEGAFGDIGLDVLFTSRLGMRLQLDAAQLGYTFTGNGQMSNGRDGDLSSIDVGGAADRYLGASLTLAIVY